MDEKTVPLAKHMMERKQAGKAEPVPWGEKDMDYSALFDQTGECVFIIGLDLRYLAANQQALSLLGYTERELVGMLVSDVMSLDEELTHLSILGGGANLYERILRRKDGSLLPVEISTSIVYNKKKEPAYIQSIARNISDRKNAEEILKKHTRILSVISDATAQLLRSSSIESRIPQVLESLGRAMDVFCCAIFEINTFSAKPFVNIQYQWVKAGSPAIDIPSVISPQISTILKESSGHFFLPSESQAANHLSFGVAPIHGTLGSWGFLGLFDNQGKTIWSPSEQNAIQTAANLIGSALQRNDYEETIRLSEARNRIILSALPDLLIRVDLNGAILDYSANPNHPLYVHRDVISGRKLSETWPVEVVEQILGVKEEAGFKSVHVLPSFTLPFSRDIYESRLYPISLSEALIVVRNINEQAKLDEMKSDFINRASHELRTPVTSAILMTELIQGGGTTDELNEYWRTLTSELNRQKILIDRLLIAGRLESGMMKLERTSMDLLPVLVDSVQAVKAIANKRKVSLRLNVANKPIQILGDKSALEQVFINLLNNAAKFSPEGKTVRMDVLENESQVGVIISDQGLGIPSEAIPYLFERFYRAKNVTIAEIPGSGIGLYIVKSIVEELGGGITVDSKINEGTKFIVTLNKAET